MSEINVHESSVDERRIRATLDEKQLLDMVAEAVAQKAGLSLKAKNVHVRALHISSRGGGLNTNKYEVVCEIVEDRSPQPADGEA